MRKIVVNEFLTLDGVIQGPGGPDEDTTGGFKYGGWTATYWDGIMLQVMGEASKIPYDLLLGRKTYEIFAAHWPYLKNDEMADKFNKARKYVATNSLESASWENTTLLSGDVVSKLKKLKQEDGTQLQVFGSANFVQALLKNNLVDEMNIWIFPLVTGKGKRLFAEGTVPSSFKLISSNVSGTGVMIGKYVPDGDIPIGSFAPEHPSKAELERRKKWEVEG